MKLKHMKQITLLAAVVMLLSGCSGDTSKLQAGNTKVGAVLEEQVAASDSSEDALSEDNLSEEDALPGNEAENTATGDISSLEDALSQQESREGMSSTEGIDYDLSSMSSSMAYSMLYQFTDDPDTYIGKTIRISGTYGSSDAETKGEHYFFVIVQDEAACCMQGMEFIWEDGSHIYPNEYPPEGALIEVTGTFATYQVDGVDYLYCTLKDSSLSILE